MSTLGHAFWILIAAYSLCPGHSKGLIAPEVQDSEHQDTWQWVPGSGIGVADHTLTPSGGLPHPRAGLVLPDKRSEFWVRDLRSLDRDYLVRTMRGYGEYLARTMRSPSASGYLIRAM